MLWVIWLTLTNKQFLHLGYWEVLLALVSSHSKHIIISQGPYKSQGHVTYKSCDIPGIYDPKKLYSDFHFYGIFYHNVLVFITRAIFTFQFKQRAQ